VKNFEGGLAIASCAVRDDGHATALRLAGFAIALALAKDRAAH